MTRFKKRKAEMLDNELASIRARTDRIFAVLMWLQWIAGIALALFVTPYSWEGATQSIHVHVTIAVVLGGVISLLPLALAYLLPGHSMTRLALAVAQMMWSGLLIHLTGGRIETHFHVFGSLALLSYYLDWKVMLAATSVTVVDHLMRGAFMPESIYGLSNPEVWRSLEHGGWVIFEDFFLLISIRSSLKQIADGVEARVHNDYQITRNEEVVELRTLELRAASADLAERNKMLSEHSEALQRASELKSDFLANMSHQIRTPMSAILGYTDFLADVCQSESSQITSAISTIQKNGGHLLTIVSDILDLAKAEAGRIELQQVDYSLRGLLNDVADRMAVRARSKSLKLSVSCDNDMPELLNGDPARLRQILMNLVSNAVKYTDRGSISVQAVSRANANGMWVQLKVQDTGSGLTSEQIAQLQQPWTQSDDSSTRCPGIGLVIVRRLVDLMHGTLRVDSELGVGSSFFIDLPCRPGSAVLSPNSSAPTATRNRESLPPLDSIPEGLRVLVVDDCQDNQRLLQFLLRKMGAITAGAINGLAGIEAIADADSSGVGYDIVLMDMQMPVLDGYSAATRLRASGVTLPIIAITAYEGAVDRRRCLESGCSHYIAKPIQVDAFRDVILRAVSDRQEESRNIEACLGASC